MNNNPTVLEIDLSSIEHNLNFFRSKLQKGTKVLAVVKASAYGSDPLILSHFLEQQHVDYFAVAYTDEGITLRNAGIKTPILVLHPQISNLELLIEYDLEPNLYSKKIFLDFLDLSNRLKLTAYPIHIKFNTGLNRLGFKSSDTDFLLEQLKNQDSAYLSSIFSHLVASEDGNESVYSINQIKAFKSIADDFTTSLGYQPVMHMSNTSGIINYPEAHFNMVRLGLGLFGFTNDPKLNSSLKNVLSLKTVISQIHQIDMGQSVGYNRGFISQKDMKTATLPIGHADGFFRSFGQGMTSVEVNGHKAPVIGNVCMDMIMIDVTNIQCEEGDQVIIFDSQQDILDLANAASTISYEILTAFTSRIRRISI